MGWERRTAGTSPKKNGRLRFTFPERTVTGEAQIIGSLDESTGTWLWAWANPTVDAKLKRASERPKEYGDRHKVSKLMGVVPSPFAAAGWQLGQLGPGSTRRPVPR